MLRGWNTIRGPFLTDYTLSRVRVQESRMELSTVSVPYYVARREFAEGQLNGLRSMVEFRERLAKSNFMLEDSNIVRIMINNDLYTTRYYGFRGFLSSSNLGYLMKSEHRVWHGNISLRTRSLPFKIRGDQNELIVGIISTTQLGNNYYHICSISQVPTFIRSRTWAILERNQIFGQQGSDRELNEIELGLTKLCDLLRTQSKSTINITLPIGDRDTWHYFLNVSFSFVKQQLGRSLLGALPPNNHNQRPFLFPLIMLDEWNHYQKFVPLQRELAEAKIWPYFKQIRFIEWNTDQASSFIRAYYMIPNAEIKSEMLQFAINFTTIMGADVSIYRTSGGVTIRRRFWESAIRYSSSNIFHLAFKDKLIPVLPLDNNKFLACYSLIHETLDSIWPSLDNLNDSEVGAMVDSDPKEAIAIFDLLKRRGLSYANMRIEFSNQGATVSDLPIEMQAELMSQDPEILALPDINQNIVARPRDEIDDKLEQLQNYDIDERVNLGDDSSNAESEETSLQGSVLLPSSKSQLDSRSSNNGR
jgi:hypothetical protein